MIKANMIFKRRDDDRVVASGLVKEFKNIDYLIMWCGVHSNNVYYYDYELVENEEGGDE